MTDPSILRSLSLFEHEVLAPPDEGGGGSSGNPPAGAEGGTSPDSPSSPPSPTSPTSPDGSTTVSGEVIEDEGDGLFDAFSSLDDLDEVSLPPEGGSGPRPEGTAAPAGTPAQPGTQPQQPAQPAAPAAPQAAQPPPAASPPATSEPDAPTSQAEAVLRGMENAETATALRNWLAQNTYALSDAERQALDTDAVGAIPSIMARVHLEATKNTLKLLHTLVPEMVEAGVRSHSEKSSRGRAAMRDFFKQWPGLNEDEHGDLVNQFARSYRAMNPRAPRADAIKFVGAAIYAHLGIPVGAPNGNGAAGSRVVSRQPLPPSGRAAPAFTPARPGARTVDSNQSLVSPYEGLGMDFDEE